ncbi:hypothetical protein [Arthrobacter roseus]|uniref:hypothetical protein n=1 Tax=Arthrobacter roseus TaxID=136274 RepID=UPI001962D36E|nr:hypothetical protein [Arthrobacter roseus]MBM7849099.1 type VI protein secretion system component VasK [Arthrobacter roseus]
MSSLNTPDSSVAAPAGVRVVSGLILVETAMLIVVGIWYAVSMFRSESYHAGVAFFSLALIVLAIGWLLAVSIFLYRGYRWTRSAALVWQLFLIVLAFPLFNGEQWFLALCVVAPAATILLLLFSQPVVDFMGRRSENGRTF